MAAEVLVLRDGRKIVGKCRTSGSKVAVARGLTTTYVPRASIERVELHPSEQRQFERMRRQLRHSGASGQYKLGKWLDDHLQYEEAEKFYRKALELKSDHSASRLVLGYRKAGKEWVADPSKQLARAAMGFGTSAAEACAKLGKTYARNGKSRAAEHAFRRALVADPHHRDALELIQSYLAGYKPKNPYRKPLVGKTLAVSGHNHRLAAYMYHAIDFAKVDEKGKLYSGDGRLLEGYHAFGAPVHAAAAGEVILAEGRFPDVEIGKAGNFLQANRVCIRHAGGEFTLYAHLKQHSVVVRKGQRVRAGTLLGRVGNSGSSLTPHLHFCLYDSDGISLPIKFTESAPEPAR